LKITAQEHAADYQKILPGFLGNRLLLRRSTVSADGAARGAQAPTRDDEIVAAFALADVIALSIPFLTSWQVFVPRNPIHS
jgi:hypothetical protein